MDRAPNQGTTKYKILNSEDTISLIVTFMRKLFNYIIILCLIMLNFFLIFYRCLLGCVYMCNLPNARNAVSIVVGSYFL